MDKIIDWLMSCGYDKEEAVKEANIMVEQNRHDGGELLSREFVIDMIVADISF